MNTLNFKKWLEVDDPYVKGIGDMFGGMAGAFHDSAVKKAQEYAKRIHGGEDQNAVLQGIKPNGAMWNLIMGEMGKLKQPPTVPPAQQAPAPAPAQQPAQPAQQPAQPAQPQISVSGIEQKLGVRPGSLDLQKSQDGQFVFVRNRMTGKSVSVAPNPAEIEKAARQVFGVI